MTGFVPNITGTVLDIPVFVLNITGLVLSMTGFSLNMIGFVLNMTESDDDGDDDESIGLAYVTFSSVSCYENKPAMQAERRPLTNGTPLAGKINTFSKITITFEPIM